MDVNGILLLYYHPLAGNALTLIENIRAFRKESKFRVWEINTLLGFPEGLENLRFRVIVLHFSIFDPLGYRLCQRFLKYLGQNSASYKVAFLQDEYHYCQQRFAFINRYKIDCIYTLIEPEYFKDVYEKYTSVSKLVYCIPGYVDDDLVSAAKRLTLPEANRTIDVGYRGQRLPYYMGKGAQEKCEIAPGFVERARELGLKLDIETDPTRRIYGDQWYRFLANCRAVLGVEAGVSVFDIEDVVRPECERLITENPGISMDELSRRVLESWEDTIPYRMISPRHFEAAAFRVCQILFDGKYSGVMKPMVHYIPLKKDFSNFDDVIRMFKDDTLRRTLAENAYNHLIASGDYSYRRFVEQFDQELGRSASISLDMPANDANHVTALLRKGRSYRYARAWAEHKRIKQRLGQIRSYPFPGRDTLKSLLRG